MPALSFPLSSSPGSMAGEGGGLLVNCYVEKEGDVLHYRRVAGLTGYIDLGLSAKVRGLFEVNGQVISAHETGSITKVAGVATTLTGAIPAGTDGISMARNNRAAGPDVVLVREGGGAFVLNVITNAVSPYPTTNTDTVLYGNANGVPATVTSVASMDGFLIFSAPLGKICVTGLNTLDCSALSFATAESKPDGIVRGIVASGIYYAMGSSTIEPWKNVGTSPFPLARVPSVIPVGLLAASAVAGMEEGWDHNPYFVAHDGTVRELAGYRAEKVISTPAVERFIAASTTSTLVAFVYTQRGHAFWCLSSDAGTWCYDVSTGVWHQRTSAGSTLWRAYRSVKAGGAWIVGDRLTNALLFVDNSVRTEFLSPMTWLVESAPFKGYPDRMAIPALFADFTLGRGDATTPNPQVTIEWSRDGGGSWSVPVTRSLGAAGKYVGPVRVNRLGLQSHHGLRVRFAVTDPVDFSFMGASVPNIEKRAP